MNVISTKALSAVLEARARTFSGVLVLLGLDQSLLQNEFVDEDLLGRVARLLGREPDVLLRHAARLGFRLPSQRTD